MIFVNLPISPLNGPLNSPLNSPLYKGIGGSGDSDDDSSDNRDPNNSNKCRFRRPFDKKQLYYKFSMGLYITKFELKCKEIGWFYPY